MDPWRFARSLVTVGRSGRGHLDPKLYEPVEIFFKGLEVPPQRFDVLGDFLRRLLDLLASAYVHLFAVAGTADCPSTKQQTT
jgi:hypothetical protein